ncbi:MAG: carboxypeptidase-like regulatory domain-containing protein [Candidatus Sericytochromatia bacterium]|nr:carboxypeptidase-like regulatory domain-containing protein [Candidatus Sericytochromatia bacterium]
MMRKFSLRVASLCLVAGWGFQTANLSAAAAVIRQLPSAIAGEVVDAVGRPVPSALVSLRGRVGLAVTDDSGRFTLEGSDGVVVLVVSAPGYVTREVGRDAAARIVLEPLPVYEAAFVTPARGSETAAGEQPVQAFPSRISLGLSARQWMVAREPDGDRPGRVASGLILNMLDATGQFRAGNFLVGVSTSRVKGKLTVGGLLTQPDPQPTVEESTFVVSAGPVFGDASFEWVPSLVWTGLTTQVSNANTPWTGTPLDYAQNRQGLGLGLDAGTVLFGATLRAGLSYTPLQSVQMPAAPYEVTDFQPGTLHATLALPMASGLDLEVQTSRRFGSSKNLAEAVQDFRVGVAYRPDRGGR